MQDLYFVECLQPFGHLDHGLPDFHLIEESLVNFMVVDFLLDVSGVGEFHNDAESLGFLIKESFFIIDDIGMGDGSKDSDFVECVFLFFLFHLNDFDLG